MSVATYLSRVAEAAILRDQQKQDIQRSIETLRARLTKHFATGIRDQFVFGSFSRGTCLPRSLDRLSDVDYMVTFANGALQPQSYLDQLKRFTERYYSSSEVVQDHPTVALEMNHVRFELVPAVGDAWSGLRIPTKVSGYQAWQPTDPNAFNSQLTAANQANHELIKPLTRLIKYWNACAEYPFESFALERHLVQHSGAFGFLFPVQLRSYFYRAVRSLTTTGMEAQWKRDALDRLKSRTSLAETQESTGSVAQAEATIQGLLPLT